MFFSIFFARHSEASGDTQRADSKKFKIFPVSFFSKNFCKIFSMRSIKKFRSRIKIQSNSRKKISKTLPENIFNFFTKRNYVQPIQFFWPEYFAALMWRNLNKVKPVN